MHGSLNLVPDELATLGYTDLSHVSETETFRIYHARTHDNQAVLIKAPVTDISSSKRLHQLEHELEISSELNPDYVVRPHKLERGTNLTALILEDCLYPPLSELLNSPLPIEPFLNLAIGITSALAQIHQQGLVHRDISPENIFATVDGRVKLSGFGIASRLTRERQPPTSPQEIVGSLAYMAPEQTGRMNRSIDTRSDLYALGIVLYRMLTGELPFNATDTMGWVHCHIAIQAKPPHELNPTLPATLSEIVIKLMAKDAEERYQTAEGLKRDLQHCLDEWLESKFIEPFELGIQDMSNHLVIPEKLYGRANEVRQLLSTVDRVVKSGNTEILLVSGYSGVGKSALVNEMHRSLFSPNALFAEGKFDQFKKDTPYATLAQALQALVRHILGKGQEEVTQWRQNLKRAVQPNGRLVTDLVPDLIALIGEQPAVAEVPPQDAQNRFNNVIRHVIELFARPEHPLVLFLDDLQWLDAASLQLLDYLLGHPNIKHLLLVGAYRNNEVGPRHPLRQTIEDLKKSARLTEIVLKPLTTDDLSQLIADSLHTDLKRILPLASMVREKTGGNPFFVTQFLYVLADEGLLTFDARSLAWQWDLKRIHAKGFSENVADLMLEKIDQLHDETQQALKQLACLGTVVKISILLRFHEQSEERLHLALWEAVQAGLVLRQQDTYCFLHDQIREAAYALIPPKDRPQTHLDIGRKLLQETSLDSLDEILYEVVNHLNQGVELIGDPAEICQLAELNSAAGRKAQAASAYSTARQFFATAAAISPEEAWQNRYSFLFTLHIDWAEAEYLHGDYEQAEKLFTLLEAQAKSDPDLVRYYMLKMSLYPITGKYDDALCAGIKALEVLGETVPENEEAIGQAIDKQARALKTKLRNRPIEEIPQVAEATDPRARIMIDLLSGLGGPAYIGSRPELYPLFAYMNLNQVLEHGVTKAACHTFSAYALLQISSLDDFDIAYQSSKVAVSLSDRFGDPGVIGSTLYLHGNHVNFWLNPFASDFEILERGFRACADGGNLAFANYIGYSIVWQSIERGDHLEDVMAFSQKYADFALESRNEAIRHSILLEQQFVKCLQGRTNGEISFSDNATDESASLEMINQGAFTCGLAYYHTMKMLSAYLMGNYTAAQSHAEEALRVHSAVLSQPMQVMFYFLHALILARSVEDATTDERKKILKTLVEYRNKLAFWARYCPSNFAAKHALVAAQVAVVENDAPLAERYFEQAIESARKNGFIHWQAMANEAAARFHANRAQQASAHSFLREARQGYENWGAIAKAQQLSRAHSWLEQGLEQAPPLAAASLTNRLDTLSLIKAAQRLSADIELPKLIKALMTITLESAGADRGLLFLARHNRFEAEVEASARGKDIFVKELHTTIDQASCSVAIVNSVINTRNSILIDNAIAPDTFTDDPYLHRGAVKSIFCLPLIRQNNLNGVLYLENRQTTGAFTHERTAVLDVLASQAAISLENAYLYSDLRESEGKFRNLVQKIQAAVIVHAADTRILTANSMAQEILGLSQAQLLGKTAIDPAWRFLREDGSQMPAQEYPVNQVLASRTTMQNMVVGVDRPDHDEPLWALVNAIPLFDEAGSITQVIVSFSDITERKKAEQQLVASEQLFRTLVENSPDHIARYDLDLCRVYINPALEINFKAPIEKVIGKTSKVHTPLLDPDRYMANLRKVIKTGREVADETAFRTPTDEIRWASSRFAPEFDLHGEVQFVLVISNDITEQKLAEAQRQENMHLLQSLDRINRVLQTEGDIEQIMHQALDEVLDIFDCDRAYMIYPCDPEASFWSVQIERARQDYPGAAQQGPQPMDDAMSSVMRALLETNHPIQIGPGRPYPITAVAREKFNTRSVMAMGLRPRTDTPWQFGIQQCSHERIWSEREERLFEEIGHRLSDGLNSLLVTRDMRESEARFRLVFERSPVSIQEEDYSEVKTYLESRRPQFGDDLPGYLAGHPEIVQECARLIRMVDFNHAALALHEAQSKEAMLHGLPQILLPESLEDFRQILTSLMTGETNIRRESVIQTMTGHRYPVDAFFSVCPGYEQSLSKIFVSLIDISKLKQAEQVRQQHLHFLESLDRINQVLKTEGDMEEILSRTLDVVLDIFDCDRTYLQYPCDPEAASEWRMPMERCKPDYPSPLPAGNNLPYHPHIAQTMQAMLDSDTPLRIGPSTNRPIPQEITEHLGVRSLMAVALYPMVDRPWQFGIHQCSYDRIWTDQEARLLDAIGHRLSDGLNSLLVTRDMRESEARFRLVFESSPISIHEDDYTAVKAHLESLRSEYGDNLTGYLTDHPNVVEECAGLVRMIDVNQAALRLHQAEDKQALLKGLSQIFIPETMDHYRKMLVSLMQGETHFRLESKLQTLTGKSQHIDTFVSVCPGYEENLGRVLVSLVDISSLKQAEFDRQQHLHFLESLNRVNKVLSSEGSMQEILNNTLDEVLEIFNCDRAYLLYPSDPDSPTWSAPIERTVAQYPAAFVSGVEIPMNNEVAWQMKLVLDADQPVRGGPGNEYPVAEYLRDKFNIRAFIAMTLYPKVDRPWQFGIQQCSHERIWTDQEARLLEEIGHRLSDGLNNLMITRNLRKSEEQFRLVYENSPVSIWEEDFSKVKSRLDELKAQHGDDLEHYLADHPEIVQGLAAMVTVLNVNNATLELHEADSKEALYEGLPKTFIAESYDAFRKELLALSRGETELLIDGAVQTLRGKRREVTVSFSVCPGYEHDLSKVFVSLFDITQRKRDEENLRLAASVFSTSQEGILISDANNRIIDVNPAFSRLTGYSREEALGENPSFLSAGRHDTAFYQEMWQSLHDKGEWQGEVWNQRKSGQPFPELLSIVAVNDDHGYLQHYVGAFSDISMIKQHEADLDRIAHYDMLTSVPNRRLLGDRLEQAIAYTRRHGKSLAVCYLDLDGFKPINDQFGHEGGDRMLVEIAHRLQAMSRGEDTVARLGGDEFVLLWNEIGSEADCVRALERILEKVSEPMLLEDEQVSVSASIGVTLYPDDNVDADSLLRHADHAMYTAKQLGKNRYQIFDARLERQISARTELLTMVERGLQRGEFELYYQPKVDFTTGKVIGLEALLRWNDPILGLVLPNEFLALIENDNLALRVGRMVLEETIRQAKRWDDQGIDLPISVNIFPRHLKSRSFIDDLRGTIALHWPEMPAHRLLLEIIETSELEELEPIEEVINECLKMGVGFSLDDFGTGYSSLVYLRRLSIEELKIDKSFVRDMLEDPDDEAIVVGVIRLGQAFGLRVVAEGVENSRQAQYLVDLGCNIVQGYALGRPMPVYAFQKWYAHYLNSEVALCQT